MSEELIIGEKYVMDPPFGGKQKGEITRIVEKANERIKLFIEAMHPHHANGMDWYKTEDGEYGREDWFHRMG